MINADAGKCKTRGCAHLVGGARSFPTAPSPIFPHGLLFALGLFERFESSLSSASRFVRSTLLSRFSYPLATRLARHISVIRAIIWTHISNNIFLTFADFSSN
jgi:hypothetical protein